MLPKRALIQASVFEWIRLDKHLVLISTKVLVARHAIHNCKVSFRSEKHLAVNFKLSFNNNTYL